MKDRRKGKSAERKWKKGKGRREQEGDDWKRA
jgi:hypothetical protein